MFKITKITLLVLQPALSTTDGVCPFFFLITAPPCAALTSLRSLPGHGGRGQPEAAVSIEQFPLSFGCWGVTRAFFLRLLARRTEEQRSAKTCATNKQPRQNHAGLLNFLKTPRKRKRRPEVFFFRTPQDVGPFFRRNFISRNIGIEQNKAWLPIPDPKPTPAWLGGWMRWRRVIKKKTGF